MDPPVRSLLSNTLGLRGPERSGKLTDVGSMRTMDTDQKHQEVGNVGKYQVVGDVIERAGVSRNLYSHGGHFRES